MKQKKSNQSGQALIELIIFLPLMFMVYSIISGFANSINASINQQKFTRGYFYYRAQNNSTLPKPEAGDPHRTWRQFGMYYLGFMESFDEAGKTPLMPCYKISIPIAATAGDTCETEYEKGSSQFIRIGTVHGICGATYAVEGPSVIHIPDAKSYNENFYGLTDQSSCTIIR